MSVSQPNAEDAELLTSGTAAGLSKFFEVSIKRGDLTSATGVALRTASRKVLEIEEDPELDLRKLDQEDLLSRFHTKSKLALNDQSRATYEGRFRKAVDMYLKFLNNEPWKPTPSKPRTSTSKGAAKPKVTPAEPEEQDAPPTTNNGAVVPPPPGMIEFPIPLRPGVQGKLILPDDLTKKEAERVVKVVSALAIDEQLAITSGPSA